MTPAAFEFTVKMPCDARLVGAVKGLTAHAAGYVNLAENARDGLTGHVERATRTAMSACPVEAGVIDVWFRADGTTLTVVIACDAAEPLSPSPSATNDGVTIDWASDGSRHICHIRQPIAD